MKTEKLKRDIRKVYRLWYPGDTQFFEYLQGVLDNMSWPQLKKLLEDLQYLQVERPM